VIQTWEVIVTTEAARAMTVHVAEASTQEAAMAQESIAALLRDAKDRALLRDAC
jgi:hypothetical protein